MEIRPNQVIESNTEIEHSNLKKIEEPSKPAAPKRRRRSNGKNTISNSDELREQLHKNSKPGAK